MLQVQYAASNSKGTLASLIGWIDFGTILSLTQHSPTATVTNSIAGGYCISFDIFLSLQGTPAALSQVKFEGTTVPTSSSAPFGNTAYTSIPGHVALYMPTTPASNNEIIATLALRNITVTDAYGDLVDDFFIVAADSALTRQCPASTAETWSVTTDGSPWELLEEIPSISGFISGAPAVTGVGTRMVTETGSTSTRENTSANAFLTKSPCQITAKATMDGSRQGFAFGVIIPKRRECVPLATIRPSHINYVRPPFNEVAMLPLKPCDQLIAINYNGTNYCFDKTPVLITGQLGTYLFFDKYVLFSSTANCHNNFDIFNLSILRGNETIQKFVVFSARGHR